MKYILFFLLVSSNFVFSQDLKSRLQSATTTEEIVKFSEKFKDFGSLQWASFKFNELRIFTIWTEPRGDSPSAAFIQAYYFDDGRWRLFIDEMVERKNISVMIDPAKKNIIYMASGENQFLERKLAFKSQIPEK